MRNMTPKYFYVAKKHTKKQTEMKRGREERKIETPQKKYL